MLARCLVSMLLLVCVVAAAYAHSGGTDSRGGHRNRSTGEYHYHHGYGPHQHPNGVCPYQNRDSRGANRSPQRLTTPARKQPFPWVGAGVLALGAGTVGYVIGRAKAAPDVDIPEPPA